jgi:hypothetical protein
VGRRRERGGGAKHHVVPYKLGGPNVTKVLRVKGEWTYTCKAATISHEVGKK